MKYLAIFLLTVFTLQGCSVHNKPASTGYELNYRIIGRSDTSLLIDAELLNNTDSTLTYLTMSCDTIAQYTIAGKQWLISDMICEKNVPIIKCLEKHSILKQKIMLKKDKTVAQPDAVLKLGFNVFSNGNALIHNSIADQTFWSKNLLK